MKTIRTKIHCEELAKGTLDNLDIKEVREMVGFYEPITSALNKLKWEVTMLDAGAFFTVNTQEHAQMIASQEEIKALLLKQSRVKMLEHTPCNITYSKRVIVEHIEEHLKLDEKYKKKVIACIRGME